MITCETLVLPPFQPDEQGLLCDGVSVPAIVECVGAPAYIYNARLIETKAELFSLTRLGASNARKS